MGRWSTVVLVCVALMGCRAAPKDDGEAASQKAVEEKVGQRGAQLTTAEVLGHAAVMVGSCVPDDGVHRYATSLQYDFSPKDDAMREAASCITARTDACAAVSACLGIEVDRGGPCRPSCAGGVMTACDDSLRFKIDCERQGEVCDPSRGRCDEPPSTGPECDRETFQPRCEGDRPVTCDSGRERLGLDCGARGLVCAQDADSNDVYCKGGGGECKTDSYSTKGYDIERGLDCQSNALTVCVNGGIHSVDCSQLGEGLSCQNAEAGAFCGYAAECDPFARDGARCEGDDIVFCAAGKLARVSCTSLGFARCDGQLSRGAVCGPTAWLP